MFIQDKANASVLHLWRNRVSFPSSIFSEGDKENKPTLLTALPYRCMRSFVTSTTAYFCAKIVSLMYSHKSNAIFVH